MRSKNIMAMAVAFALFAVVAFMVMGVPDASAAGLHAMRAHAGGFHWGDALFQASPAALVLRRELAEITVRAEAKLAEVKDGLSADELRKIEADYGEIEKEITAKRAAIVEEERKAAAAASAGTVHHPVDADAVRKEAQEGERKRASTINDLAARHGLADLGREHVTKGTSEQDFRNLLLDELAKRDSQHDRRSSVGAVGASEDEKRAQAIENALLHRVDTRNQLTEHGRQYRGMSILEMGRECLEGRGVRTRGMAPMELARELLDPRNWREGGVMTRDGGGMMGTSDFPNILANVANKTLRAGYDAAPQTFRPLVRVVTVPDFKQVSRVQLGEAPQLEQLNEHGEFKRGSMGEAAERYAVGTYGKIVAITRQVLINDDLAAFTRVPRAFGVQAAALESDLVWAQILANANMADGIALFHGSHANLGTGAAITTASVGLGRTAMSKQTGIDGRTLLNIIPAYLVVPAALLTVAEQFVGSIVPTKNTDTVPESLRRLQVVSDPRLDNGVTVNGATYAGSASNWFMAADPAQIDMIELAYLEGTQGVYTESRMGFDVDGMELKVRMDVAAKAIDFRGFYKNPN